MAVQPDTTTGTITITSGSASFTTSGTNMLTRGHLPGDTVHRNGFVMVIATITGENSGTFTENAPAAMAGTGVAVRIRFQPDGSRVNAQARNLIDLLSLFQARVPEADSSNPSKIYLYEATANGTNKLTISPNASLTADRVLTTPDADVAISAFIATLMDDADAATARGTLGAFASAGGSLSGDMAISKATPAFTLVRGATNQYSVIYWADPAAVARWALTGNNNSQHDWYLNRFNTSGVYQDTPVLVSGADGSMTLAKLLTLTAGQLAFPASQNASGGANVLDDCEEGSFTPDLQFGGGTTGITYAGRNGSYRKVGGFVEHEELLNVSNKGSSTGTATIAGMPFTSAGVIGVAAQGQLANFSGLTAGICASMVTAVTAETLYGPSSTGSATLTNSNCSTTPYIQLAGTMEAA